MLDQELRQQVARYVGGRIRRATLEHWLVPIYAEIDSEEVDAATRDLAARTIRILAERENGDWTEAEAKALLAPWIDTYLLASPPGPFTYGTSVVKRVARRQRTDPSGVAVGRERVAASG